MEHTKDSWGQRFNKLVDTYQLFENENQSDNMPFYLQKETVSDFIGKELNQQISDLLIEIENKEYAKPEYEPEEYERMYRKGLSDVTELLRSRMEK